MSCVICGKPNAARPSLHSSECLTRVPIGDRSAAIALQIPSSTLASLGALTLLVPLGATLAFSRPLRSIPVLPVLG